MKKNDILIGKNAAEEVIQDNFILSPPVLITQL